MISQNATSTLYLQRCPRFGSMRLGIKQAKDIDPLQNHVLRLALLMIFCQKLHFWGKVSGTYNIWLTNCSTVKNIQPFLREGGSGLVFVQIFLVPTSARDNIQNSSFFIASLNLDCPSSLLKFQLAENNQYAPVVNFLYFESYMDISVVWNFFPHQTFKLISLVHISKWSLKPFL